MVYDFETDIENFLSVDIPTATVSWAVRIAKTIYIGGDPTTYDEDLSDADNFLVSILASAFVVMNVNGVSAPTEFKLDEFSIKEQASSTEESKFFKMFFSWKNMFQARGVDLQYADTGEIVNVTAFTATDHIGNKSLPTGVDA